MHPLAVLALLAPLQERAAFILEPDAVVLEDGKAQPGLLVLVKRDRILAVGPSVPQPAGAERWRLEGVLAPGFVDAFSSLGVAGRAEENTRTLTPQLRAAETLDLADPRWRRWLAAGVTAVHVVPEPVNSGGLWSVNVVAGWAALVEPAGSGAFAGPGAPLAQVADPLTRQAFSLLEAAFGGRNTRAGPTSLPGALELLDGALLAGVPELAQRGALVFVDSAAAVRAARSAAQKHRFAPAWIARGDVGSYGAELSGELVGLPVLDEASYEPRALETWRRLRAAGVRIAFGSHREEGPPPPQALRTTAMAFARATGDARAALEAVTANAAAIAGQGRDRGRIAAGARADLVLWSAHPLDASARVKSVMIGGRTVFRAAPREDP